MSLLSQFFPSGGGAKIKTSMLLVGGGGGGGCTGPDPFTPAPIRGTVNERGGGGGGGGAGTVYRFNDFYISSNSTITVTVGAGGNNNSDGGNSCICICNQDLFITAGGRSGASPTVINSNCPVTDDIYSTTSQIRCGLGGGGKGFVCQTQPPANAHSSNPCSTNNGGCGITWCGSSGSLSSILNPSCLSSCSIIATTQTACGAVSRGVYISQSGGSGGSKTPYGTCYAGASGGGGWGSSFVGCPSQLNPSAGGYVPCGLSQALAIPQCGSGGSGTFSSITGSNTEYAAGGGGGGGANGGTPPPAFSPYIYCIVFMGRPGISPTGGCGGRGAIFSSPYGGTICTPACGGINATANLGGGGGGAGYAPTSTLAGGNGGSGTFVIQYPNAYPAAPAFPGACDCSPATPGSRTYRFNGPGSIILP
jgi:hypothetical protein